MLLALLRRSLTWGANRKRALRAPRPRPSFVPRLTLLEDRTVPSTFTVKNLNNSGPDSLRAAIAAANANPDADTIKFAGALTGTITLTSELSITQDVTIDGTGANKITVSGGGVTRVFNISGSSTDVTINKLTIANGRASVPGGNAFGGGLLNNGASVSLDKVVFTNNQAVGLAVGGGAVANLGGHFTADHTDFLGNTAQSADTDNAFGGAVYNDQGAISAIDHATFSGNRALGGAGNGGAIGAVGGSQVTLNHSSFDGNEAQGSPVGPVGGAFGGAIHAQRIGLIASAAPTLTITHCSFTGNQVLVRAATNGANVDHQANGGAIRIEDGSEVTVSHSTFDGNRALGGAGGDGGAGSAGGAGGNAFSGAIANGSATLIVSHSQFTGNEVHGGNGGKGGSGGGRGGSGGFGLGSAISSTALSATLVPPTAQIDHCEFVGNRASGGDGGAGGSGGNGGDGGRGDGGAIINLIGTITVSHCSILQNAAQGGAGGAPGSGAGTVGGAGGTARGGGFSNNAGGTATVSHTAIVQNRATGGAGGTGATGGAALGGGAFNGRPSPLGPFSTTLTFSDCTISGNLATGGAGGVGGNGGNAFGGGIFNGNPPPAPGTPDRVLYLYGTHVTDNQAVGGAAGAGGTAGLGQGGGLYNQTGALAFVDAFTTITGNDATTSDDDIFGIVTPI